MKAFAQLVFGYHGCERDLADRIVLGNDELHPSENHWDWLGSGVYFWESAPERAWDWAKRHCKNPAVIGAVIDLGRCMNLMDVGAQSQLQSTYQQLSGAMALPVNGKYCHNLDCMVVDAACKYSSDTGTPYDTVRGAFPEGDPVFENSKILTQTHVQICVRNLKAISAFFLPLTSLCAPSP